MNSLFLHYSLNISTFQNFLFDDFYHQEQDYFIKPGCDKKGRMKMKAQNGFTAELLTLS